MKSMQKLLLVFLYLTTVSGTLHAMDVNHGNEIALKDETYKDVMFCKMSAKRDLESIASPRRRNTVVKVLPFKKEYEQFNHRIYRDVVSHHQEFHYDKESVGNIYFVDGKKDKFNFFNQRYGGDLQKTEVNYENRENDLTELAKDNYINNSKGYKRDKYLYEKENKLVEYTRRSINRDRVPFIASVTRDKITGPKVIDVFVDDSFYIDSNVPDYWSREKLKEKVGDVHCYGDLGEKMASFYKKYSVENKILPIKYYKVAINKNGDEKVIEIDKEEFTENKTSGKEIDFGLYFDATMLVKVENDLVIDKNVDIKAVPLMRQDEKLYNGAIERVRDYHKKKYRDKESNDNVYLMNIKSFDSNCEVKDFEIEEIKEEEKQSVEPLFDNDYINESELYKSNDNNVINRIKKFKEEDGKPFVARVEKDTFYELLKKQYGSQKFTHYNLDKGFIKDGCEKYKGYCMDKINEEAENCLKSSCATSIGYCKINHDENCFPCLLATKLSKEEFENILKRKRNENSEIDEYAPPKKKQKME